MPLPKRRHSNQRTRLRRTHYKLVKRAVGVCPRCHAPAQPHHACPSCGYYKGRQVLKIDDKQSAE
ncbi:MAG: 50S ribosomal protein L32 [Abditibacteriota bacterium]|nr:50S ribosomal protein L32 [Abditibacteriota bacterium]MBP5093047.1 50S ribosomal protein L32 [Abditibacteriota bacterium]MBP5737461.1 50S ribosomal protein L32 [Abditibacteriota bacterium]MBQ7525596.1 50S ribosomal protein L32 [Abditibacteriota bacterium]